MDHTAYLYEALQNRIFGFLHYQVKNLFPNVEEMRGIAMVVPGLNAVALKPIVKCCTQPLIFDYTPYMEYVQQDKKFGAVLDRYNVYLVRDEDQAGKNAVDDKKVLNGKGTQTGKPTVRLPATIDSKKLHDASTKATNTEAKPKPTRAQKRAAKKAAPETEPQSSDASVRAPKASQTSNPPTCYNCNKPAHLARNCANPQPQKSTPTPTPPICYTCNAPGHLARNCPAHP
ncbi:hypothetical protein K458DRAFT_471507 [Lentithecium fluviatile CBS 122367]|uniref:CCHC-type domain-containing protein n=1 Tax=Lentithecium fluviatile CBS 122367 TaxID=1168545 RepID=A0A6G1J790_9PLEO|nr:hypothetical protein K458DRAFT_471507 [Lentithecium fluviatile CBS 122367]